MRYGNKVRAQEMLLFEKFLPSNSHFTEEIIVTFSNYFSLKGKEQKLAACLKMEEMMWPIFSNWIPPVNYHFSKICIKSSTCNVLIELH